MKDSRLSMAAAIILFFTVGGGQTAMALEEPEYEVLIERETYEVRRYEPYLVAEVDVVGGGADSQAFRILAGYIFGNNQGGEKMQMTAPVESRDAAHENEDVSTYAFVMERKYTLDTLPQPMDNRIRLLQRPERTIAVRRYSGRWSESKYESNKQALLDDLAGDNVTVIGDAELARYDSPFKPWFLRRNEILVPIDEQALRQSDGP